MGSVYALTLRQLSGKWRLTIMAVLALLPVIVALITLRAETGPTVGEFEQIVFSAMLSGSIAPMIVLAIAAAAFANEIEDRTIANLTLAPIPRWQIAVPKLLAIITLATPFIAASSFLTSHVAFIADTRATVAIVLSSLVGVALYSSAFMWLGLATTQAIGIGLLYIVLWEGFFSGFVAGVRLFSIRHYGTALMHGLDERRFAANSHLGLWAVIIIASIVFGGFLLMSVRRLRRMDIP